MIHLYSHGGSGNHGCEAIVRSSVNILQEPVKLFSNHIEQDIKYGVDQICEIIPDLDVQLNRGSAEWFASSVQTKLTGRIDLTMKYRRKSLLENISKDDIYISIGGDNYCYAGTEILAAINNNLRKKGARTILWGCSVEPVLIEKSSIAKDLAGYDLITARESISYEALKKVNCNTVLVPDPAFTLQRVDLPLPEGWIEGNMVGINASPLIFQSAQNEKTVFDAYRKLIEEILVNTDCGIALIPHVVWEKNNDLIPLKALYEEYKDTGRIVLVDDCNCMELKGYIARCRFFVGARTHATIAAYSSCVPTLVLGYSVKSRGIARDLFGTEKSYVISVKHLTSENELAKGFLWLKKNEETIRRHLRNTMPKYIETAKVKYREVSALNRGE